MAATHDQLTRSHQKLALFCSKQQKCWSPCVCVCVFFFPSTENGEKTEKAEPEPEVKDEDPEKKEESSAKAKAKKESKPVEEGFELWNELEIQRVKFMVSVSLIQNIFKVTVTRVTVWQGVFSPGFTVRFLMVLPLM